MGPILDTSTLGVDANTDDDSVTVSEPARSDPCADGHTDPDDPGTGQGLDTPMGLIGPNGDLYVASCANRSVSRVRSARQLGRPLRAHLRRCRPCSGRGRGETSPKVYLVGARTGLGQSFGTAMTSV
jgi:hypothetical protein